MLLPALRSDLELLPLPPDVAAAERGRAGSGVAQPEPGHPGPQQQGCAQRRYLTCCVRLSPEKEAHRLVAAVEVLAQSPAAGATNGSTAGVAGASTAAGGAGPPGSRLEALGVVPLMCGAAASEYGAALQARLLAAAPHSVVEPCFLAPPDLAKVPSPQLSCVGFI